MIGASRNPAGIRQLARLWLLVMGAGLSLPAVAARPAPEAEAVYAHFAAIAGEPQDAVRFFRIYYWQPISDRALVLWLGREEPYLIELREHCFGLSQELSLRIADYQRPGRNTLRSRWSAIITRSALPCRIGTIRALDFSRIDELDPRFLPESPDAAKPVPATAKPVSGVRPPTPQDGRRWASLVSVHMQPPEEPKNDAGRGKQGVSYVAAEVAPDGMVRATEILVRSGDAELDAAALEAVMHWRFEPYRMDEHGTPVWVQVPIVFSSPRDSN